MKKGKRIRNNVNFGETLLPEAMIQHIQSFMSGKEAAQTTLLSKSWYNAWSTRPNLDIDRTHFRLQSAHEFEEFATKTMQRYVDLSLKIDSFRLLIDDNWAAGASKLIVNAMKIGATDIQLVLPDCFTLPQEVMASETLVNLSLTSITRLDGNHVSCSSLKSLSLTDVIVTSDDGFKHIISCCNSLEELSLSRCYSLIISRSNLYELLKLRRLFLSVVDVDNKFFTDFASRFPCLKDLSILRCRGYEKMQIDSPSLQTIAFEDFAVKAKFDVPNICKFTYEGYGLPSKLSITGALWEWKLDITLYTRYFQLHKPSWFVNLKKLLKKFRLSRIALTLEVSNANSEVPEVVDTEVAPKPLVMENLTIDAPSSHCCAVLVRLFGICRPKFLTLYQPIDYKNYDSGTLDVLCKRLTQQQSSMFGQFGLEKVKLELYEMIDTEWRPLLLEEPLDATKPPKNKRKVRFELIWE